jgi:chemotaxis signal transduction protein
MEYDFFELIPTDPTRRMITFAFRDIQLALPIDTVSKVIRHPHVLSSGLGSVGIAHVGEDEVTVFDLYQRLYGKPLENTEAGFMVLIETQNGELFGIPVAEAPGMEDIPESAIRPLPESYRRRDSYGLASHVALIQEEGAEETTTIFLLDIAQLEDLFEPQKLLG